MGKIRRSPFTIVKLVAGILQPGWISSAGDVRESNVWQLIRHFTRNEQGATAIEYGLIAAGISVAIIAVVQGVGGSLVTTFTSVQTALK
jgi:pilus assembly protein Flp/PilA